MAWEYLLNTNMDFRITAALPYIHKHTSENTVLVDLDCGHSPLLYYSIKGNYIGNDIFLERLVQPEVEWSGKRTILPVPDEDMYDYLSDTRVDVLCVFGVGGFSMTKEPLESATLTNSIFDIMNLKPLTLIVLEGIEEFVPVINEVVERAERIGYSLVQRLHMKDDLSDNARISSRVLFILERNETNPS